MKKCTFKIWLLSFNLLKNFVIFVLHVSFVWKQKKGNLFHVLLVMRDTNLKDGFKLMKFFGKIWEEE